MLDTAAMLRRLDFIVSLGPAQPSLLHHRHPINDVQRIERVEPSPQRHRFPHQRRAPDTPRSAAARSIDPKGR
jgi:hypothetical protein